MALLAFETLSCALMKAVPATCCGIVLVSAGLQNIFVLGQKADR